MVVPSSHECEGCRLAREAAFEGAMEHGLGYAADVNGRKSIGFDRALENSQIFSGACNRLDRPA
jgi:hypothetical protein